MKDAPKPNKKAPAAATHHAAPRKRDGSESDESSETEPETSDDEEGGRLKNIKELKRTAADCMAIDVRNPISVFPFRSDDVTRHRSKYGPNFPIRRLALAEFAWGAESTPERAMKTYTDIDATTMWKCVDCSVENSRLKDICTGCKRERFETTKEEEKKTKVRSVLPRSKEATELRRKLHAKLRSQYQKQLEQFDDLASLL